MDDNKSLGQVAYEAMCAYVTQHDPHRVPLGGMPAWEHVPEVIREGWQVVAKAVVEYEFPGGHCDGCSSYHGETPF